MRHVVLCGLPGSGKTTVGKLFAEQQQKNFIDLDAAICARAGASVSEIFAQQGESAFRAFEQFELGHLQALTEPSVIALGGGAIASHSGFETASALGDLIWLSVAPHVAATRLHAHTDRPLLGGGNRLKSLRTLLTQRSRYYGRADVIVDARDDMKTVAKRIATQFNSPAAKIIVQSQHGDYPVRFSLGDVETLAVQIAAFVGDRRAIVIGDLQLATSLDTLVDALNKHSVSVSSLHLPAGESLKSFTAFENLLRELMTREITRDSILIAVGGGSLIDSVGFAAAIYTRGIPWICVPTTLLSMVDSSIGGKVGINMEGTKNLLGAFYPPLCVLTHLHWLITLPDDEIRSGIGEMLKVAATHDDKLFAALTQTKIEDFRHHDQQCLTLVVQAAAIKARVVSADEFEHNLRRVLNFGHTFGHAFEAAAQLSGLRHGEAVMLGMIAVSEFAMAKKQVAPEVLKALTLAANILGLKTDWRRFAAAGAKFLQYDKKRMDNEIRLVIVPKIGTFAWLDVTLFELVQFLQHAGDKQ